MSVSDATLLGNLRCKVTVILNFTVSKETLLNYDEYIDEIQTTEMVETTLNVM